MKKFLLIVWVVIGASILLWHFGPGQAYWQRARAAAAMARGLEFQKDKNHDQAAAHYAKALSILPVDDTDSRAKARIGLARAQIQTQGLSEARLDMEALLEELPANSDPALIRDARLTLAESQYYNTWLLRLEGAPREVWEPEIESARQIFRHAAESAPQNDPAKEQILRNLESTVRLARMELTELQGMPIPSQCKGCRSCKGKKPGSKKKGQKPNDDVRSAGGGLEMDNSGD